MEDGESDLTDHINHNRRLVFTFNPDSILFLEIWFLQIHRLYLIGNLLKSWKPLQISVTVNLKVGLV